MSALDLLAALVTDTGQRWAELATAEQRADAAAVLDVEGPRLHWLGRPRGGSKTTDLAGLLLAVLVDQAPPGSRSFAAAVDQDQAGILHDAAAGFVRRTPALGGLLEVRARQIVNRRSGASVEILAADGASAFGLLPYFTVIDELAQWPSTIGHRTFWEALVSALPKVAGSRLACLTSAGDPAHWSYRVLTDARTSARWRVSEWPGPLAWRTEEDLAVQRSLLTESQFGRLHLGIWCAPEDRLTTADAVAECVGHEGVLAPLPGVGYVVSVDLGVRNDATAVAVGHLRRDEGDSYTVVVDRLDVFRGTRKAPLDLSIVEEHIERSAVVYNGADVVVDPWQAMHMAQGLRRRGLKVQEFTFSAASTGRLGLTLYRLLRDRLIDLPNDADLLDELAHVELRQTSPGVVRLDHASGRHDDQAVAIALLAHQLLETPPRRRRRSIVSTSALSEDAPVSGGAWPGSAAALQAYMRGTP